MMTTRKRFRNSILTLTCVATLGAGCFGQFALTRKIYSWNASATGNEFANSALMWGLILIPVYPLASFADIFIFNTIEVLSGQNPVALNEDGTATFKYAGAEHIMRATTDGAVEVSTDGSPSLRYRKDSDMLIIEDLRSGKTTMMPMGEARALANRAIAY